MYTYTGTGQYTPQGTVQIFGPVFTSNTSKKHLIVLLFLSLTTVTILIPLLPPAHTSTTHHTEDTTHADETKRTHGHETRVDSHTGTVLTQYEKKEAHAHTSHDHTEEDEKEEILSFVSSLTNTSSLFFSEIAQVLPLVRDTLKHAPAVHGYL
jgi:hypothetical protein